MRTTYRKVLLWLGSKDPVVALASRFQPGIDRFFMRFGRGRVSTVASMPALLLTTTGRKTGSQHTVPLFHVPAGSGWAVTDTSYGRPSRPAWSLNLEAGTECTVRIDGRDHTCTARTSGGDEFEGLWGSLLDLWPLYGDYAARSGRSPRVWILEPDAR